MKKYRVDAKDLDTNESIAYFNRDCGADDFDSEESAQEFIDNQRSIDEQNGFHYDYYIEEVR